MARKRWCFWGRGTIRLMPRLYAQKFVRKDFMVPKYWATYPKIGPTTFRSGTQQKETSLKDFTVFFYLQSNTKNTCAKLYGIILNGLYKKTNIPQCDPKNPHQKKEHIVKPTFWCSDCHSNITSICRKFHE